MTAAILRFTLSESFSVNERKTGILAIGFMMAKSAENLDRKRKVDSHQLNLFECSCVENNTLSNSSSYRMCTACRSAAHAHRDELADGDHGLFDFVRPWTTVIEPDEIAVKGVIRMTFADVASI
ncbi:hypothetical protein [Paraburkholderia kirstenboschensis]|uniref:hypothetical protein n=1 Tax=Paraburkholderia kirstenboschensis TaxID=1245436 RepID=UPI0013E38F17|nr:hypothetical protein [Paraburkholderia kirstenboschensis]